MRRRILLALIVALLCVQVPLLAKDKKGATQKGQAAVMNPAQQQKEALIGNINAMRNQELRVAVLQQLFNEEVEKLKNFQTAFCNEYKLDLDKFRKGLYRYDEKQGKFVEAKQ
ncbi:MAG: hypothetical protein PHC54_07030 [Candidatus Omnitrophica bacterium]|nr:hypothetical protein [Candidatus Omnitrophota bacterium]MDD5592975.1 hypothetical protein [Candidatus Omnitrophota bacterium]